MTFNDELLDAIGDWQKGWNEDQDRRNVLAARLRAAAQSLDTLFRSCSQTCYRKRFLMKGELCDILMIDSKSEGIASWTTDLKYAEQFKGRLRQGAVSAAIFEHTPRPDEVIINVNALWRCDEFLQAVETFSRKNTETGKALKNFRAKQGEVVLEAPLKGSEIIALVGTSSPFDELCDSLGLSEADRREMFTKVVDEGIPIGQPTYISRRGAQDVIASTIKRMWEMVEEAKQPKPPDVSSLARR